ncbi:lipid A export permease/ATP-binding protein MsbA [Thalassotalea eurytherma]|uniref:Lipid A export ATP-binding/permease protein MsbA n=1 Tax=Thalassotalea eurytherma TaxID=1144278 RepID=A0ABQ6H148_9GAMM|nr:lipid A export permease/ATP-binding protein MsbA [Thalassotalea eurytherma]GLX81219.1 lipid A export ATP-binding/permease protein MsbA [Thalassotalea eurytherma]
MQNTEQQSSALSKSQEAENPSTFKRLMSYAKAYKKGFIAAVIGMLGYAAVDSFVFSQLQPLIDEGLTGKNPNFMQWAPLFIIVMFILRGAFHFIGTYCLSWVGNHVVADLRQELFEHIIAMPVDYHDKNSAGSLISKITYDTEQVLNASSKALLTLVQQGAFVTGLLIVMFYNSWQLSAIFLLLTPVIAVIVSVVSKRFRAISKHIQDTMGEVTTASEQTINGHKVVLTFDGNKRESERFADVNKRNRQQRMKMIATKSASVPIIQIIASFALAFVLYLANTDAMRESLTPGSFTTVITCMAMLLRPLKLLTTVNSEFQRGMAACASIFKVLDEEIEKDTGTKALGRAKGNITFDSVHFTYEGEEKPALNDISFDVSPGQTVALVGRSGSGKSTLSSLLLRFYQANQGQVLIDGEDINEYKLHDLRNQFAYVSQQVVLFNDSIANNIAYGKPDATEAEIIEAAKSAHVWEFAESLPEGIHSNVGENGALLSGGQRQRVAIARAILCDAPFLILDEATSALDTESERHIQDALHTLQKNRTCLVIAHRLSTIENADTILVLEQGEIIEQGNHQVLIAKDGAYAQLHKLQFG